MRCDAEPELPKPEAKHIVIADGNAVNRDLIRSALGAGGVYRITEAGQFCEALAILKGDAVDLLILAQEINGVSSIDHIRRIRSGRCQGKADLPIIVLIDPLAADSRCGHPSIRARRAGATACLSKPLSIKKLHAVIHRTLNGTA